MAVTIPVNKPSPITWIFDVGSVVPIPSLSLTVTIPVTPRLLGTKTVGVVELEKSIAR